MAAHGINGFANGIAHRPLLPGIYAPIPTFFLPDSEDLDIPTFESHIALVAAANVGPLIAGSLGEGHHLTHSERIRLIHAARKVLDTSGHSHMPIIVGTGVGSTRETVELTQEVAAAGADYVIVIASGYFSGVLANHKQALKEFWREVSEKSPIPVIIYNFPGAAGGIDLDSDLIVELATECPNLCGVKLTCGNVGKLTRIADIVSRPEFAASHPRQSPVAGPPFLVLGGFADFLAPSAFANGHGAISGLANISPYTLVRLFQLSEASRQDLSALSEAQRIQGIVARGDHTIAKASIAGTKYLMEKLYGYGGLPRKPLPPMDAAAAQALWEHPHTQDLVRLEREFSGKVKAL